MVFASRSRPNQIGCMRGWVGLLLCPRGQCSLVCRWRVLGESCRACASVQRTQGLSTEDKKDNKDCLPVQPQSGQLAVLSGLAWQLVSLCEGAAFGSPWDDSRSDVAASRLQSAPRACRSNFLDGRHFVCDPTLRSILALPDLSFQVRHGS